MFLIPVLCRRYFFINIYIKLIIKPSYNVE